jgi:hypothetical protein
MLSQWYYNRWEKDEDDKKDDDTVSISTIRAFDYLPFIGNKDKQAVDPYGKTRAILINNSFVILTSPLPSLNLPAISDTNNYDIYQSYNHTDKDIKHFLSRYKPSSITLNSDHQIVELHFSIINITLTIKTKPFRDEYRNLTKILSPLYPSSNQNNILDHVQKVRLASIMIEYFLYFFSCHCRDSGLTPEQVSLDKKGAVKTLLGRIVVDRGVVYSIPQTSNVDPSFQVMKDTHFMSDDNQFICDSTESRKRLLYTLYTHLMNNFETVMSYVENSEIHHFYSSAADYDIHNDKNDHTLIVNDLNILQIVNGDVHNTLQRESDLFFMKNEMISRTPVQVKKASDREEAVRKGMRRRCEDVDDEEECPVRYFLYQSKNEVDVHGREDDTNADVLVYKVDTKLHYNGLVIL